MKKLLLISFAVLLFGAGCSQNTKKTEKLDYFDKKQTCISYKKDIEKDYKVSGVGYFSNVSKIFYSPSRNSCLFTTVEFNKELGTSHNIYDYMTKEKLYEVTNKDTLNLKVNELEGGSEGF